MEAGDLIGAIEDGRLDWGRVAELSEIVTGRAAGRQGPADITLFESQGLAVEDLAAAHYVYREVTGSTGK
jgi:ornithine cyclodeaminase/alanine dehydrogenase-like protein (mu-crystallin family)